MTDERYSAIPLSIGPKYCTSATRPPTPRMGDFIEETDTGRRYYFTGEAWQELVQPDRDPSVSAWREATGQSTSAQLRLAGQALADVERERDEALTNFHDMYEDLVQARAEAREFRAQAELYLRQRDNALHDLARVRHALKVTQVQHAAAVDLAAAYQPGAIVIARQDVGDCVLCGRPIVRGQGVEAVPGTTEPTWRHAECPDPKEGQR